MSEYIELYKKYRPRSWKDMIGQENVVTSLKSAVVNHKIPTAYLFSGAPGTGKTTAALILAKALNCENIDQEGNPCNECDVCKAIDNQAQMGVKYISMANNGSAEDVRKIMAEARLSQPVKKQVWIMDEVQNLSPAAQDALLIGLESENMKSLFIFCTTDPEKIKPAVMSRVQQRTFSQVRPEDLGKLLVGIIKKENLVDKFTKESIIKAALDANGSVRNAIRNIELIATDGVLPNNYANDILLEMTKGNPVEVFNLTSKMANEGQSFVKTAEQLYKNLSVILIHKAGSKLSDTSLKVVSDNVSGSQVLTYLTEIGNLLTAISNKAVEPKILFEVYTTKLALLSKKQKGGA